MIKLNLGAGALPLKGHTNIDIRRTPHIDKVWDCRSLKGLYDDCSVDEIFSKDTLEHFGLHEWENALIDWIRVLKTGGVLKLRVPDLLKLFESYQEEKFVFGRLVQLVFGDQDFPENTHRTGFTSEQLREFLTDHGMVVLKEWHDGGRDLRITATKRPHLNSAIPAAELGHPDTEENYFVPGGTIRA